MSTPDTLPSPERITIILHSGAYDRVSYALCIAQAGLASGMEVHMLLTFEGLRRFVRGRLKKIDEDTSPALQEDLKRGLKIGAILPLDEQLEEARNMGLRIYACPNAMASLNIPLRDLQGVDEVMGLVAFLQLVSGSMANWYI